MNKPAQQHAAAPIHAGTVAIRICTKYHEHCVIIDGILSTGEEHELPADYKGGWFDESKDHAVDFHGKNVCHQTTQRW